VLDENPPSPSVPFSLVLHARDSRWRDESAMVVEELVGRPLIVPDNEKNRKMT
jgi:hypothetical protein